MSLVSISAADREVYHDMVTAPGKYEGCPDYVPFYMELACLDCADETYHSDEATIDVFHLCESDYSAWPQLPKMSRLYLWTGDDGIVSSTCDNGECEHTLALHCEGVTTEQTPADERARRDALADYAADDCDD